MDVDTGREYARLIDADERTTDDVDRIYELEDLHGSGRCDEARRRFGKD